MWGGEKAESWRAERFKLQNKSPANESFSSYKILNLLIELIELIEMFDQIYEFVYSESRLMGWT